VLAALQGDNRTVRLLDYSTGEFIDSVTLDRALDAYTFFETGAGPSALNLVGRVEDTIVVYQFGMPTDVPGVDEPPLSPLGFELSQNHPNPFNSSTVIEYSLPTAGLVVVEVYNLLGQEVVTLTNDYRAHGTHNFAWDGTDSRGAPVASGVYFARMSFNGGGQTVKMVLQR
jgi:hypothetical protein